MQTYNRGVENSGEENALAAIDRGSFVRENCRRNRCCFRIVHGANVRPDHASQRARSALGGGSLPSHLAILGGFALLVFSRCLSGPLDLAGDSGGAWIDDVAASKLGAIEFEIRIESSVIRCLG